MGSLPGPRLCPAGAPVSAARGTIMVQSVTAATRISEGLATFIGSLCENKYAARRALMLLGTDELGIDLTLVVDDLRLTMAARERTCGVNGADNVWKQTAPSGSNAADPAS